MPIFGFLLVSIEFIEEDSHYIFPAPFVRIYTLRNGANVINEFINSMPKYLTEDEVRNMDKDSLGFNTIEPGIQQGTGQLTTFNQLGIKGVSDKPDGWYIPANKFDVAIILETKNSNEDAEPSLYFVLDEYITFFCKSPCFYICL